MSDNDSLDIDPRSPVLQYEIVEDGVGRWRLERTNPEYPRTPEENRVVTHARSMLPTDAGGQPYIPPRARDELDAEPGDVISLFAVINAQIAGVMNGLTAAFELLIDDITDGIQSFADAFETAFEDAASDDGSDDDDGRRQLPEPIREARKRAAEQREAQRRASGWYDHDDDA